MPIKKVNHASQKTIFNIVTLATKLCYDKFQKENLDFFH